MYRDEVARQALQEILDRVHEELEDEVHGEHPLDAAATGKVHGLLSVLASTFLTQAQQQQVKHILELHCQCLYGDFNHKNADQVSSPLGQRVSR